MGRPITVVGVYFLSRSRINRTNLHPLHRDTIVNRANVDAKIASNAFFIDHFKDPAFFHGNGLVRGVFTGGIATTALDAAFLVDLGLGHIVEIQVLPICYIGNGSANKVID